MRMSLTGPRFVKSEGVAQLVRDGVERLRAVPGVINASATCCVPLQGGYGLPFKIVGRKSDGPFDGGGSWMTVSPGYFEVFKIPVTARPLVRRARRQPFARRRDHQRSDGAAVLAEG